MTTTTRRTPPAEFGGTLRALRVQRGWSQAALARLAGITPCTVANLESGRRSPSTTVAEALVAALRADPATAGTIFAAGLPNVGRDRRRT